MVTGARAIEGWKLLGGGSSLACLVVGATQPLARGTSQQERHGSTVPLGYGHGVSRAWAAGGPAAQTLKTDSLVPYMRPHAFLLADPLTLMEELQSR